MASLHPDRLSLSDLKSLSSVDLELEDFLQGAPSWPDPPFTDINQCRSISDLADKLLSSTLGPTPSNIDETSLSIPITDSFSSHTTVTRPSASAQRLPGPLVVLFHPGGFFLGHPIKLTQYARGLAMVFGATVLCPSYRFAPEFPFPDGIKDAWASLRWISENCASVGADPTRGFIVGGISTGANYAAALARTSIEQGLKPAITGLWTPLYLGFIQETVPTRYMDIWTSWEQNKDALVIDSGKADVLFGHYKPDFRSPLFNPTATTASDFDLSKMPRTFIQVAGADLVRDDGIILAYILQDHNVQVKLEVYQGVPHSFWVFAPNLKASAKFIKDIVFGFAWLLEIGMEEMMEGWEDIMASPTMKLH